MGYLFSLEGNFLVGIVFAGIMAYVKYSDQKKEQLPEPKTITVATYPHQRISEFVVAAMVAGIGGAKLFNAFETWDDFIKNPVANLISSSGLTFYGGLITAAIVIILYARKHKISVPHLVDSFGPAMMLAYGIGRLGCQFAGDGDWGVFNSAYVTQTNGKLAPAHSNEFVAALHNSPEYLGMIAHEFGGVDKIPHLYKLAPHWLPDWLFAMNYPNNVNNEGMLLTGSTGNYNAVLPVGVFPTPLYEALACILLFFVLWAIRKRMKYAFHLTGWYLILNGLERFFVEQIRVNYKYNWGFIHPTQAEIISVGLMLFGVGLLLFYKKRITPNNIN
jgi:prolipoprotein diacylglyceryltransferase